MYFVLCRDDTTNGRRGDYVLATRQGFVSREHAEVYASGISPAREPFIVEGSAPASAVCSTCSRLDCYDHAGQEPAPVAGG